MNNKAMLFIYGFWFAALLRRGWLLVNIIMGRLFSGRPLSKTVRRTVFLIYLQHEGFLKNLFFMPCGSRRESLYPKDTSFGRLRTMQPLKRLAKLCVQLICFYLFRLWLFEYRENPAEENSGGNACGTG